ncbi:hypothetical protein Bcep1808_2269 [Burkholderia vietnamiensis G4]|uniref:Uncharacterized protein n=1 Tax=Burkholderia vietnamiensis (strain G4 / LMG 22486) TaxID=269482 RepID=A4JG65_BURVG|nr:hypothetical protein Bcep1808_2269 [Burkholderia vietnamiensis G4]
MCGILTVPYGNEIGSKKYPKTTAKHLIFIGKWVAASLSPSLRQNTLKALESSRAFFIGSRHSFRRASLSFSWINPPSRYLLRTSLHRSSAFSTSAQASVAGVTGERSISLRTGDRRTNW